MKQIRYIFLALVGFVVTACAIHDRVVSYRQAQNYFVFGDTVPPTPFRILSVQQLGATFGMAAVMGRNGEPTRIDFASEFAIAVVLPETNLPTELEPVSLVRTGDGRLRLTYRAHRRPVASWTMRPFLLLIVSRKYIHLPIEAVELSE